MKFAIFLKSTLLNILKAKTAVNAKISVLVICVEAIIYLLFCNLQDRNRILIWLYSSSKAYKCICLIYAKQITHSLDTI